MRQSLLLFPATSALCLVSACSASQPDTSQAGRVTSAFSHHADAGVDASVGDAASDAEALDADAADTQAPVPSLSFVFQVPGAPSAIEASVTEEPTGHITIDGYPTATTGSAQTGPLPVGYTGAFSDAFCAQVRTLAEAGAGTGVLASFDARLVRQAGAVALSIPVSPFLGSVFASEAAAGATAAGAPGSAFDLTNPLVLDGLGLTVDFAPDAMSRILGGTDSIAATLAADLAQDGPLVALSGQWNVGLGAKDVLCDLANGKATLTIALSGTAAGEKYLGAATITHLQTP